jgi:predicted transcriptional regulator
MSEKQGKSNNLHPLQKLVVLHLAKNGPHTINKTANSIKHEYKATHVAFEALEEKGVIKKAKNT